MSGEVSVLTLHQGCGLTNAMTGITEAAKSRTSMLVLAAEANAPTSNFAVDQAAMATAVGASTARLDSASDAVTETVRAFHLARDERRTVVVNLPLGRKGRRHRPGHRSRRSRRPRRSSRRSATSTRSPNCFRRRQARPDCGPRRPTCARDDLVALADACGALLATSAVARQSVQREPLVARRVRWVRVTAGCVTHHRGRCDRRLRLRPEHVDYATRSADRAGRTRGTGRRRARRPGRAPSIHLGVVGDSAVTAAAVTRSVRRSFP